MRSRQARATASALNMPDAIPRATSQAESLWADANRTAHETLLKILNDEGINIARRTVAKYRDELNIPSSTDRKQIF